MVNLMVDKCISKFPCSKYSSTVTFTTVCYTSVNCCAVEFTPCNV